MNVRNVKAMHASVSVPMKLKSITPRMQEHEHPEQHNVIHFSGWDVMDPLGTANMCTSPPYCTTAGSTTGPARRA